MIDNLEKSSIITKNNQNKALKKENFKAWERSIGMARIFGMKKWQRKLSVNLVPVAVAGSFVIPKFQNIPIQSP